MRPAAPCDRAACQTHGLTALCGCGHRSSKRDFRIVRLECARVASAPELRDDCAVSDAYEPPRWSGRAAAAPRANGWVLGCDADAPHDLPRSVTIKRPIGR